MLCAGRAGRRHREKAHPKAANTATTGVYLLTVMLTLPPVTVPSCGPPPPTCETEMCDLFKRFMVCVEPPYIPELHLDMHWYCLDETWNKQLEAACAKAAT